MHKMNIVAITPSITGIVEESILGRKDWLNDQTNTPQHFDRSPCEPFLGVPSRSNDNENIEFVFPTAVRPANMVPKNGRWNSQEGVSELESSMIMQEEEPRDWKATNFKNSVNAEIVLNGFRNIILDAVEKTRKEASKRFELVTVAQLAMAVSACVTALSGDVPLMTEKVKSEGVVFMDVETYRDVNERLKHHSTLDPSLGLAENDSESRHVRRQDCMICQRKMTMPTQTKHFKDQHKRNGRVWTCVLGMGNQSCGLGSRKYDVPHDAIFGARDKMDVTYHMYRYHRVGAVEELLKYQETMESFSPSTLPKSVYVGRTPGGAYQKKAVSRNPSESETSDQSDQEVGADYQRMTKGELSAVLKNMSHTESENSVLESSSAGLSDKTKPKGNGNAKCGNNILTGKKGTQFSEQYKRPRSSF